MFGSGLGFVYVSEMKLVAKPSPPNLAAAIHAVDLLLNILFDPSSGATRAAKADFIRMG
jgi:hypothetical protein